MFCILFSYKLDLASIILFSFGTVTLRQLIAAWFSRRYTRFKKHSADFHGRAADLVHGLRGTAMPMRQALKEEQCREEKGISTVPKHKYASKACSPKGSKGAPT
ncbi:2-oxoglutarate dehydrogenase E1 component [Zea mays]|uniref:2-oxoglutarate dehydrogenase E1 component n=1 Tax=Zea mays TaxID=4577 RepID=A0A1D6IA34_MAIZE|nr:2-oxoglutarate dehydrogenase E1 component [Zea mays]ONM56854.1 2-oxoglutarate dehydrogenase E1 component [Zea mays]